MTAVKVFIVSAILVFALSLVAIVWWDSTRPVTIVVTGDPDATIEVQIVGAVASPGLVSLPAGSRLDQAITAAGGLSDDADLSRLYLAARLGSGERIVIPTMASVPPSGNSLEPTANAPASGDEMPTVSTHRVNINTATVEELDGLPGIGNVLAHRIVTYRETHGPFSSVDQLGEVEGIGAALLEKLRPLVTTGD